MTIKKNNLIYTSQVWHVISLSILLFLAYITTQSDSRFLNGNLFNISTKAWFTIALASAILHQFYVLFTWRYELYHQSLTKAFGQRAFKIFKVGFAVLIISRPVTVILLAISNANTLYINPRLKYILSSLLLIPVIYLAYSVRKFFGIDRAFGIDHFYPEKYRNEEYVKEGIFKYSSNAMYVFGFLFLWIPGILLCSKAAIVAAMFHHVYIWVHYYCTERGDMAFIYDRE